MKITLQFRVLVQLEWTSEDDLYQPAAKRSKIDILHWIYARNLIDENDMFSTPWLKTWNPCHRITKKWCFRDWCCFKLSWPGESGGLCVCRRGRSVGGQCRRISARLLQRMLSESRKDFSQDFSWTMQNHTRSSTRSSVKQGSFDEDRDEVRYR